MDVPKNDLEIGEEEKELAKGDPLPADSNLYRIVVSSQRDKINKQIPAIRCFSLSQADKDEGYSLSVDLEAKTTAEESVARIGCQYKMGTTDYKDCENREIYSLNANFLKALNFILKIVYDPLNYLVPIKGTPENLSHSLICFKPEDYTEVNEPLILTQIRNHAKDRRVDVNMEKVRQIVEAYKNDV